MQWKKWSYHGGPDTQEYRTNNSYLLINLLLKFNLLLWLLVIEMAVMEKRRRVATVRLRLEMEMKIVRLR